jgi:CubicO group peptidase (beta-lactamase class C family)
MPPLAEFIAGLETSAARDKFTGTVHVVRGEDEVFAKAYGYASRAWRAPCTLSTRYDTASITKVFTAVATLQLVERGAFALDTSTVAYLGMEDTNISPAVTPYHLLTHTSGIADDADEEAGERWEDLFVNSPTYAFTEIAHHLPHFVGKPANFAPGEGSRYCNAGYLLLGMMIEKATGTGYREYVQANVFERAGMAGSAFLRMDIVEPDVAEAVEAIMDGDRVVGWRRSIFAYPPIGDPAGGAYVTAGDLVTFHRALTGGKLLGPDLTAEMLRPHEVCKREPDRTYMNGYGFMYRVTEGGRVHSYWKEGVNVGVSGMLRHYPAEDVTLAILGVGEDAVWDHVNALNALIG